MTKIYTKASINWQSFKERIFIHCAVGTAAVYEFETQINLLSNL